jgi:hypothetical protein
MAGMLLWLPTPASANQRISTLGKDSLGETLKEFQDRYPKAVCGTAASAKTKPQNLTDAEATDKVYCYLDDRDTLTRISLSSFLNLDVRVVTAIFWKSRLYDLGFDVNVRSIRTVLGPLEKIYGPPALIAMDDPADATKLTYVCWVEGNAKLHVWLPRLGGEVSKWDSTHLKGQPRVGTVCVDLLNSDLAPDKIIGLVKRK